MMLVFVLMFTGSAMKLHTMREVNQKCIATSDSGPVCKELVSSKYLAASTNKTLLGMDD